MPGSAQDFRSYFLKQQWFPVTGSDAPPYGCVEITSDVLFNDATSGIPLGVGRATVRRPEKDGVFQTAILGPQGISGGIGYATFDLPAWVRYDDSGEAPAAGDVWGPQKDSYELKKNVPGYWPFGDALAVDQDGNSIMRVGRHAPSTGVVMLEATLDCDVCEGDEYAYVRDARFIGCTELFDPDPIVKVKVAYNAIGLKDTLCLIIYDPIECPACDEVDGQIDPDCLRMFYVTPTVDWVVHSLRLDNDDYVMHRRKVAFMWGGTEKEEVWLTGEDCDGNSTPAETLLDIECPAEPCEAADGYSAGFDLGFERGGGAGMDNGYSSGFQGQ